MSVRERVRVKVCGITHVGDAEACVAECAPFAARSDAFGTVARRHMDACEMETDDAQALRSMASNLDQAKTLAERSRFKEASKYLRAAERPVKENGASRTAKVRALQDACASLRARFSEPFAREDAYDADPQVRAWSAELRVLNDRFGALWHLHDKGNMAAERELESLWQRKSVLERELEARHRAMVDSP